MRRIVVAIAIVACAAVPATLVEAGRGAGELTSAFRNEINQSRTDPSDPAPLERPEGHVNPFDAGPAEICDESEVGTWASLLALSNDELQQTTWDISLDGEQLDVVQTPTRQRKLTGAFEGQTIFGFTRGVPVIGTLDEGVHSLEYVFYEDGVVVFVATRDIVSSPANC